MSDLNTTGGGPGEAGVEPYHPIAHTCNYCSQLVVEEEEKWSGGSVFDLGVNCHQATVAGAAGCLFFQTIFDLEWTDHEEVRPQINWDKNSGTAEIDLIGEEDLLPTIPFRLDGERKPPWYQGDLKGRYTYLNLYSFKGTSLVIQLFIGINLTTRLPCRRYLFQFYSL